MTLPRLVLITDEQNASLPVVEAVERALSALPERTAMLLVREKHLSARVLFELLVRLRPITSRHGAVLAVSTRLDVALAAGADAVQLGHDALSFEDARRLAPGSLKLGVSLHGDEIAPAGADWAFLSPVFPTPSKPGATCLGLDGLSAGTRRNHGVPVYALGGVDASRSGACLAAGAHGVAVLRAVLASATPERAAKQLYASLQAD